MIEKKITEELPTQSEINKVSKEILKIDFLRFMDFADSVVRYIQIKLKDDVNWLQVIVLLYIISRGGSIVPSHLARLTLRSNYSMTRLINEMAKEKLVITTRGNQDRRTMLVRVTKKGLALMLKNLHYIEMVQGSVLSCLTEENIQMMTNLTRIIIPTLTEKIGKSPDAWSYYYRGIAYKYLDRKEEALNELGICIRRSKNNKLIRLANEEIKKIQETTQS
jgi:DNA-binding MarR family transcriptional regulator